MKDSKKPGLLPTPKACDWKGTGKSTKAMKQEASKKNLWGVAACLEFDLEFGSRSQEFSDQPVVKTLSLWPTPTANPRDANPRWTKTRGGQQSFEPNLAGMVALESTSSPEASPVKTCPLPVSKQASPAVVRDYLMKSFDSLASYDPDTSSWKTSQLCLLDQTGSGLDTFSEGWPTSGMTVSGTLYRLADLKHFPLVRPIAGTGSGLWPTPDTMNHRDGKNLRQITKDAAERGSRRGVSLHHAVENPEMWPTASARDGFDHPGVEKDGVNPDGSIRKRNDQLARRVYTEDQVEPGQGSLNPDWVTALMGLPPGWLDIE